MPPKQKITTTTTKKGPGQSKNRNTVTIVTQTKSNSNKSKSNKKNRGTTTKQPLLSTCAMKYFLAVSNPWHPMARGSCIPRTPCPPSQKTTTEVSATVTCGTNGIGYILFMPTLANNTASAIVTNATWDGTSTTALSATSADTTAGKISSVTWTSNQFSSNDVTGSQRKIAGKIVSLGARAQYIGKLTDRNGLMCCYHDPNHGNLTDSNVTPNLIRARTESVTRVVGSQPCDLAIYGVEEHEYQYPSIYGTAPGTDTAIEVFPFSNGRQALSATGVGAPIACIVFFAAANSVFNVDMIMHAEFIGTSSTSSTPNVADTGGWEKVTSAIGRTSQILESRPNQTFSSAAIDALTQVSAQLGKNVLQAGTNVLLRNMKGPSMGQITELR